MKLNTNYLLSLHNRTKVLEVFAGKHHLYIFTRIPQDIRVICSGWKRVDVTEFGNNESTENKYSKVGK